MLYHYVISYKISASNRNAINCIVLNELAVFTGKEYINVYYSVAKSRAINWDNVTPPKGYLLTIYLYGAMHG